MLKRGSGVLMHVTSLPSPFGIGDLGPAAYEYIHFLAEAKQGYWQILPLNPTERTHGNSPYHSPSAFAGNPLLISPAFLARDGFLSQEEIASPPGFPTGRVDYDAAVPYKEALLQKAYQRFRDRDHADYELFCAENAYWLDDFALFSVLKSRFRGRIWSEWPEDLRDRDPAVLQRAADEDREALQRQKFYQYLFFSQWNGLRTYGQEKGVRILGDIPIYVVYDSADVWRHPHFFHLDPEKRPLTVAGVPPDYFSETGQLWGNPVYRWGALQERGYDWWIRRIGHNLRLFDHVRVDHFRGFVGYWEIPAGEKTAVNGKWVQAPAEDFFRVILREFPMAPLIAEDLGIITPDVTEVMERFQFPGMKVLLFAFGDDPSTNPYAPHNHVRNCLVYTGTHDNNTARGWFEGEAGPEEKRRLFRYLGREVGPEEIHWALIRLALMSVASLVIIPMQDLLGLGAEARMNRPATTKGNWEWRLDQNLLADDTIRKILEMTEIYGRAWQSPP